jgi:hypothetical protein
MDVVGSVAQIRLDADDVFVAIANGGGGWGDPIERDAQMVSADIRAGLVSRAVARSTYGVPTGDDGSFQPDAVAATRLSIRRDRARRSLGHDARLNDLSATDGCPACHSQERGPEGPPSVSVIRPMEVAGPKVAPHRPHRAFVLREFYCPQCWRLLRVEREATGDFLISNDVVVPT